MILLQLAVASLPGAWPEALAQPIRKLRRPFFILFGGMLLYEWMLRLRIGRLLRSVPPGNHNPALLAASGADPEVNPLTRTPTRVMGCLNGHALLRQSSPRGILC